MTTKQLSELVRVETAFEGWEQLEDELRAGYVPTLRMRGTAAELGLELQDRGYRVFWLRPD